MTSGPEFSSAGCVPTRFEEALLAECAGDGCWEMVAQRLVQDLGVSVAARALVAVLDEIGGEKVHTPPRQRFFVSLWAEGRADWARDRQLIDGWSLAEIATVLRVSESRVSQIITGAQRTKLKPTT